MSQTSYDRALDGHGAHGPPSRAVPTGHSLARASEAHALSRALSGYVDAVAVALDVPTEAVMWESTDTVTAYLALDSRSTRHPDRDLMLLWSERRGWAVCVEARSDERPVVLARLHGPVVAAPEAVVRLVAEALTAPGAPIGPVPPPAPVNRIRLAEQMLHCVRARTARPKRTEELWPSTSKTA